MLFLLLRRVKDPHEFFTGDRFLFIQHLCQLIQQRAVLRQQAVRPLMLRADQLDDLAVDLALRLLRAAHGCIAAQILIPRGLHGDHVEFIRHAVLRDHGARDARGLLDVVRSAGRDLAERDLLGRTSAGQRSQLGQKLAAGHQVLFALLDLDSDGTDELVLDIDFSGEEEYVILTCYDGAVYANQIVYRGFLSPKADGTFEWSNGAFDNGASRARFENGVLVYEDFASMSEGSDGNAVYTLNGESIDEAAYSAFLDEQAAKDDLAWTEFSVDAVNAALAG